MPDVTRSREPNRSGKRAPIRRPHALGALILRVARERNESVGAIARRAGLPRATVYALARPGATLTQTPRRHTLECLARGLELPLWQVESAATTASFGGRSVPEGYRAHPIGTVDGMPLALLMPEGEADLTEEELAELAEIALRRRRERSHRETDSSAD